MVFYRNVRENLRAELMIGVGRMLDDALADLTRNGRERPDLFVPYLYFPEGPLNSEAIRLSDSRTSAVFPGGQRNPYTVTPLRFLC
jgi:hypothetical protein